MRDTFRVAILIVVPLIVISYGVVLSWMLRDRSTRIGKLFFLGWPAFASLTVLIYGAIADRLEFALVMMLLAYIVLQVLTLRMRPMLERLHQERYHH
jgi:hypothetical protein